MVQASARERGMEKRRAGRAARNATVGGGAEERIVGMRVWSWFVIAWFGGIS